MEGEKDKGRKLQGQTDLGKRKIEVLRRKKDRHHASRRHLAIVATEALG
jgi:hypothetical protein